MDGSLRLWQVLDAQKQPLCNTDSSGAQRCRTLSREFTEGKAVKKRGEFPVHWLDDATAVFLDDQGGGWRWSLTGDAGGDKIEAIWLPSPEQLLLVGQPGGAYVLQYAEDGDGQVWNAQNGDKGRPIAGRIVRADWPDWQEDGPLVVRREGNDLQNDLQIAIGYSRTIPLPAPSDEATVEAIALGGDQLAVGWSTGLIQVWDYKTATANTVPRTLNKGDGDVTDLQWDPSEPRLLVTQKFTATLWNASNQQQLWEWPRESELAAGPIRITGGAFSPDGCCVAIMSGKTIYVVDMNGITIQTITAKNGGHQDTIKALRWIIGRAWPGQTQDADQQRPQFLVTWSGDRTARVWYWDPDPDQPHLTEVWRVAEPIDWSVEAGAVNNDGSWILTESDMGTLRAWQAWINHPEALIEAALRVLNNAGDRRTIDETPK
jgi:WD40 repeat protein